MSIPGYFWNNETRCLSWPVVFQGFQMKIDIFFGSCVLPKHKLLKSVWGQLIEFENLQCKGQKK